MLIQSYQESWEHDFKTIQQILQEALTGLEVNIHHVGSTAVKNLAAKPIIDIDIAYGVEEDFEVIKKRLEIIGYYHNGDQGIKDREAFKRQATANHEILEHIRHHLYVCPPYSRELKRHLTFRDYLRTHEEERSLYANLKRKIAEEAEQDIKVYSLLKEERAKAFIESVLAKANPRFKGYAVYDEDDFFEI